MIRKYDKATISICSIMATVLCLFQFFSCAQVDQVKSRVEKEVAFEAGNNAMANEDHSTAAVQYRKAAEAGHAEAAFYLSLLYSGAGDIPENEVAELKWMRMSAEKGYAPAQKHLGMWYLLGASESPNPIEAFQWFNKAADQGNETAMYYLGRMAARGQGVPKDYHVALGWFQMANAKGFPVKTELLTLEGVAAYGNKFQHTSQIEEKSAVQYRPATVRNVQDGLTQLGYKPGPVDGMMGKRTANAIKAFQKDVDMPVDGKVSDALMRQIDEKLTN